MTMNEETAYTGIIEKINPLDLRWDSRRNVAVLAMTVSPEFMNAMDSMDGIEVTRAANGHLEVGPRPGVEKLVRDGLAVAEFPAQGASRRQA